MWRPYEDEPLFCGEMLQGWATLDESLRDRLHLYLHELIRTRSGPVAVTSAWNAVYFGFDVRGGGGYVGGPLELDAFPSVAMGETVRALPVGALVNVTTGSGPIYAEVTYKEGAHPEVGEDGAVPGWLSGAPAHSAHLGHAPGVVLAERLVCDFGAFGPAFSVTRADLARLRSQGRWLDDHGHLTVNACYPDSAAAELGDPSYYAHFLVAQALPLLLSPLAPQPLRFLLGVEASDEDLQQAVQISLGTIRDALASLPGVRMWGMYAFEAEDFAARMADSGPLGGGDLRSVASGLCQPPRARRRLYASPSRSVRYVAVGPRLRQLADAAQLTGPRYAAAIIHANTVIAEYVRARSVAGILPHGGHVRLDDVWQSGGVWRAEYPAGTSTGIDILHPLGLGWAETNGPDGGAAVEEQPGEIEWAEAGYGTLLASDEHGLVSWTVAVRESHLLQRYCSIPQAVTDALQQAAPVSVLFTHPSRDGSAEWTATYQQIAQHPGRGGILDEVTWPSSMLPGTVVTFIWERGSPVVRAFTTLLPKPVYCAGMRFQHQYDPRVVTRDTAPGSAYHRSVGALGSLGLRDRILRAVRRLGYLCVDGTVAFDEMRLPVAVYGNSAESSAGTRLAPSVERLIRDGVLRRDIAARIDGWLRYPRCERIGLPVRVLVWTPVVEPSADEATPGQAPLLGRVKLHTVYPHLRRISGKPSDEARAAYRTLVAHYGLAGDPELPPGYTLVRQHERGRGRSAHASGEGNCSRE
ncbi:hypothetical protein [Saccharopolyspora hattusasensis]|uniref:hypothetical protein n=1 Tax=Saccharopolyspora hattusasensis TaxID=1128679 RepID=UPI003D95A70D